MPKYEVMREATISPYSGAQYPGIIWAWRAGETIQIRGLDSHAADVAEYESKLAYGRSNHFSEQVIWEYWAQHGGNMITHVRSLPETVEASSMDALLTREIRRLGETTNVV